MPGKDSASNLKTSSVHLRPKGLFEDDSVITVRNRLLEHEILTDGLDFRQIP